MLARAVMWSLGFAVAFALLYLAAVVMPLGQQIDARSLGHSIWGMPGTKPLSSTLRAAIPALLALLAGAAVIAGLVQRRWLDTLLSVVVAAVLIGASGPVRDAVFVRPFHGDYGYLVNSYPSRHVVAGLALCVVILRLWPWRRTAAAARVVLIVAITVLAVVSVTTLAHRASDVVGGVLLVGVLAPVVARGRVPTARVVMNRRPPTLWVVLGVAGVCLAAVSAPLPALWGLAFSLLVPLAVASASVVVLRVAVPSDGLLVAHFR